MAIWKFDVKPFNNDFEGGKPLVKFQFPKGVVIVFVDELPIKKSKIKLNFWPINYCSFISSNK